MKREFRYAPRVTWKGNLGTGTSSYAAYSREYVITANGKTQTISGSAEEAFRGDAKLFNPDELFAASLASCHMLWYLHLCADEGIIVLAYTDSVECVLTEEEDGGGSITSITLCPEVVLADISRAERAKELHYEAGKKCFIANTCKCPIYYQPACVSPDTIQSTELKGNKS